jgi:hypothetical protein
LVDGNWLLNGDHSGCSKVGAKTIEAAAKFCPSLISANLNYTAVTPVSLIPLVCACPLIEVLKVAGTANWVRRHPFHGIFQIVISVGFAERRYLCEVSTRYSPG